MSLENMEFLCIMFTNVTKDSSCGSYRLIRYRGEWKSSIRTVMSGKPDVFYIR